MKSFFLMLAILATTQFTYAQYQWKKLCDLNQARNFYSAEQCGTSTVLVAGGFIISETDTTKYTITNTCEMIHVSTGACYYTTPMSVRRAEFPLLLDADSNLIAVGGVTNDAFTQGGANLNTEVVERYDRVTRKWTVLGNLLVGRRQHCAMFINSSEILVVDGRQDDLMSVSSAEVFNVETGKSRYVANYPYALNNLNIAYDQLGRIICFGGRTGGAGSDRMNDVYEWKQNINVWSKIDTLYASVNFLSSLALKDERILVCGGATSENAQVTRPVANISVQYGGKFVPFASLHFPRSAHSMIQIDDYHVAITGGWDATWHAYANTEILNLSTGAIDTIHNIAPRSLFKMLSVPTPNGSSVTTMSKTIMCISGQTGIIFDGSANAVGIRLTKVVEILTQPKPQPVPCQAGSLPIIEFGSGFDPSKTSSTMSLNEDASVASKELQLVSANPFMRGSAWFNQKLPVGCGFSTDFSFEITNGTNSQHDDGSLPGADGIAFVVQNSSLKSVGKYGGGIGYDGIKDALAVEIDTYKNAELDDTNGNHVAIQCSGVDSVSSSHNGPAMLARNNNIMTVQNDKLYFVRIDYNIVPGLLRVYLDDVGAFQTPVLSLNNFDLAKFLNLDTLGQAYVGFTSATGVAFANNTVRTWRLCTCPVSVQTGVGEESNGASNFSSETQSAVADVRIVPNPANEYSVCSFTDSKLSVTQVLMETELGQKVYEEKFNFNNSGQGSRSAQIPLSTVASGKYFIVVYDNLHNPHVRQLCVVH